MSSDDIEFDSGAGDVIQDNTDEITKNDDQTSTSQQALKQLNQLTANNSTVGTSKVSTVAIATTSTVATATTLPKISGAKIVYIKNPSTGAPQPFRIGGSLIGGSQTATINNSNSNANVSGGGLQKVQLLQLKNKNVVSTAVPASSNRFVLKSGNTSQKIIISSTGTPAKIAAGSNSTNTRTITVSQAQQMGLMPPNKSNASGVSTTNSPTTKTLILPASATGSTNIALKNQQPTILNKGVKPIQSSKILIHDSSMDNDGKSKSVTAPSIVKVAGISQQVRVVPQGKSMQYVRVLNAIPSGSANSGSSKIVNGRQQPVIVQRKIVPQQGSQIGAGGKPHQFVTKKLEVMPISSTTKVIKKEPTTQTIKTPTTYLLNNVQKNIVTSSIDIKPIQSDSFEITEVKDDPGSPSSKKFASRTYSMSTERKSKSPEPNQSSLMYSTLKLPSPEPIEGNYFCLNSLIAKSFSFSFSHFYIIIFVILNFHCRYTTETLQLYKVTMFEIVLRLFCKRRILFKL